MLPLVKIPFDHLLTMRPKPLSKYRCPRNKNKGCENEKWQHWSMKRVKDGARSLVVEATEDQS